MTTIEMKVYATPEGYASLGNLQHPSDAGKIVDLMSSSHSCIVEGVASSETANELGRSVGYIANLGYGIPTSVVELDEGDGNKTRVFSELNAILSQRNTELLVISGFERIFEVGNGRMDADQFLLAEKVAAIIGPKAPKLCAIPSVPLTADGLAPTNFSARYLFKDFIDPLEALSKLVESHKSPHEASHIVGSLLQANDLTHQAIAAILEPKAA